MLYEEQVREALKSVKYPGFSRDILSFGLVKSVSVADGTVQVELELTTPNADIAAQLKAECERVVSALPGANRVLVHMRPSRTTPAGLQQREGIPGIDRVIAIASGKGGVGKSTCSVNLACALAMEGANVGLLDCDIYGPSIPLMMGVTGRPAISETEKLVPLHQHGVRLMSMGFLLDGDQPVIWRGPMIVKTIQQFIHQVDWGQLDFLLVDLPPGTGDAQLTLCQTVPLDGGVIVTTPQEASLGVVRKGINMFRKVNVPILGIIENMSHFTLPNGDRIHIFGQGGGRAEAVRQDAPFLGEIPLFQEIRVGGDAGLPVAFSHANHPAGQAFHSIAQTLRAQLS
ncbi:MAG: iron-sulfur cluster carrier protein ApbC [Pedosphaera sp.]|nr:iron-sulfur cluster carrier protein ApbC [Pedosphaera sp.]